MVWALISQKNLSVSLHVSLAELRNARAPEAFPSAQVPLRAGRGARNAGLLD